MKKFRFFGRRGLSVILSLALCMGLASPAFAAMNLEDALDDSGGWKEEDYRREQGAFVTDDDGSEREEYYLEKDLQLGQALDIRDGRDVTIDLNGKTLEQTGKFGNGDGKSHSVIDVSEGAKLTIEDSSGKDEKTGEYVSAGDGKITGGRGTLLTDDYIIVNGGGVAVVGEGSTFTLKGGNITGNSTHEYGYRGAGGGILGAFDATINIEGGTISDNTGGEGGGIALWGATLNMSGGSISNNHADGSAYYGYGGGIAIDGNSSVNITGGTFSGNTADNWGDDISIMNYAFDGKIDGSFSGMTFTEDTGDNIYVSTMSKDPVDFHDIKGTASASVTKGSDFRYEGYQVTGEEKDDVTVIKINGDEKKVTIPEGASVTGITEERYTVTYPGGAELDVEKGVVTSGGSVEITVGEDGEKLVVESSASGNLSVDHNTGEVTVPQDGKVTDADGNETTYPGGATIKPDGTIEIPEGGKITDKDGTETTYPDGATIDKDGNIDDKGSSVTKKDNEDGSTTITNKGENGEKDTTITLPKDDNGENKGDVTVDDQGNTNIPEGGKITDKDGTETTYPDGATIDKDGNIDNKGSSVTKKDNEDGSTTITNKGENGEKDTTITLPKDDNGENKGDVTVDDQGNTNIPEGGKVTDKDGTETTYPDGATIDKDGNIDDKGSSVTKKDKEDGSTTITNKGENGEKDTTITLPKDDNGENKGDVTVDDQGNTNIPEGGKITDKDGTETTYPDGATIDKDGNIDDKGSSVTKKDNEDGSTTITNKGESGEKDTTITLPKDDNGENKGDVTVDDQGNTNIPEGGKVTDKDGTETTYPDGATIDKDGNIDDKGSSVTKKDNEDGSTTITNKGENGEKDTTITLPKDDNGENKGDVTVDDQGNTNIPEGGKITDKDGSETTYPDGATIDKDGNVTTDGKEITKDKDGNVTIKDGENETKVEPGENGGEIKVNPDGSVEVPAGGKIDGVTYPDGATIGKDGTIEGEPEQSEPADPGDNNDPSGTPVPGGDDGFGGAAETTINEAEVPLAGIVLVKDVLTELYKHSGSPDGADAEGEYVKAIAWAITNGIVTENDDMEAVVTVAVLKEMLANYAALMGGELTVAIDGEDGDVVMNCGEILEKLFETLT